MEFAPCITREKQNVEMSIFVNRLLLLIMIVTDFRSRRRKSNQISRKSKTYKNKQNKQALKADQS